MKIGKKALLLRDCGNLALFLATRWLVTFRLWIQITLGLTHNYHPDPLADKPKDSDPRLSHARWLAMKTVIGDVSDKSVMDVGCHQGYFVIQFAKEGAFSFGIDNDRAELMVGKSRVELARLKGVFFSEMTITPANLPSLPTTDIVVFLSVFHHWVRAYGEEVAKTMLQELMSKAREHVVFDTGMPDEVRATWASELEFMKPDGRAWMLKFFEENGFRQVVDCGEFPTTISGINRPLLVGARI